MFIILRNVPIRRLYEKSQLIPKKNIKQRSPQIFAPSRKGVRCFLFRVLFV